MEAVNNPFQACRDIILKPNRVFAKIRVTDNWSWIPFLLVTGCAILSVYSYLTAVDIEWLRDSFLALTANDLSPAETKAIRDMMGQGSVLLFSMSVGMVIKLIVFNAIMAAYLNMCSKADDECVQGFTDWFGFCWWTSLPLVAVSLMSCLLTMFAQTGQISQLVLEPTSLAYIFSVDINSAWFGFLGSLKLEYIWIIYLTTVGLNQWTSLSMPKIYRIALAPYVLIWSLWLLIMLF
ncbi:YIP1 family protein [Paraglaciecola sp.]|uniref:YIP1 family protein n=1 Tax=Paraglaciecola sp. TaxID=1920173 RepID=UPI0030F425CB